MPARRRDHRLPQERCTVGRTQRRRHQPRRDRALRTRLRSVRRRSCRSRRSLPRHQRESCASQSRNRESRKVALIQRPRLEIGDQHHIAYSPNVATSHDAAPAMLLAGSLRSPSPALRSPSRAWLRERALACQARSCRHSSGGCMLPLVSTRIARTWRRAPGQRDQRGCASAVTAAAIARHRTTSSSTSLGRLRVAGVGFAAAAAAAGSGNAVGARRAARTGAPGSVPPARTSRGRLWGSANSSRRSCVMSHWPGAALHEEVTQRVPRRRIGPHQRVIDMIAQRAVARPA